jgi:hypothetical protein
VADNPRIEELRRRVQKDPASIAFAQLAEEYRRSGEHEEAVRVCRAGLAKHPSYLSARVTLGRALIELAQYDEARTELDYVLRSAPENLAAIRGLAEIYQRRGELAEALKQYQTALGIAKHDPELEEAVDELTRQLGGVASPRAGVQREARAAARANEAAAPPPIPLTFPGETTQDSAAPLLEMPAVTLETFEPPADPGPIPLSPELEAAADEFTRALEALDAITIDVPAPALSTQSFELPPLAVSDDDRLVPAQQWEHAALAATAPRDFADPLDSSAAHENVDVPEPVTAAASARATAANADADAIADLQNWLDNIVLDRGGKR